MEYRIFASKNYKQNENSSIIHHSMIDYIDCSKLPRRLRTNNKYSPRYRGSKSQIFKSPIRGGFSEAFLTVLLQLNKQGCRAILSSVKIYNCQSKSNAREYVRFFIMQFSVDGSHSINLGNSQIQQGNSPKKAVI